MESPDAENTASAGDIQDYPVVLQCAKCRTILSDTLSYYVSSDADKKTVTVSDARLVTVANDELISKVGWDKDCCFQLMSCSTCFVPLGRIYSHTTPSNRIYLNNYTFASDALMSYQLGSIEYAGDGYKDGEASGPDVASQQQPGARRVDQQARVAGRSEGSAGAGAAASSGAVDAIGSSLKMEVAELDVHVGKLTTATNQLTKGHRQMENDMVQLKQGWEEVDAEQAKMENIFLVWEERIQRAESLEKRVQALEKCISQVGGTPGNDAHVNMHTPGQVVEVGGRQSGLGVGKMHESLGVASDGAELVETHQRAIGPSPSRANRRPPGQARGRQRAASALAFVDDCRKRQRRG